MLFRRMWINDRKLARKFPASGTVFFFVKACRKFKSGHVAICRITFTLVDALLKSNT